MISNTFVGKNAQDFAKSPSVTVDRVIVSTGSDAAYYSPSGLTDAQWYAMTGKIVSLEIPFGTQAIADNIRTTLSARAFKPYKATCAELDPAAELGDWVTVDGVYSLIAKRKFYLDSLGTSDISADTENNVTDKYPYLGDIKSNLERVVARIRSELNVQADKIALVVEEVEGDYVIKSASIITAINDDESSIKISADKVDITGLVTFEDLDGSKGVTVIDGSVIDTGTIKLSDIACKGDTITIKNSAGTTVYGYIGEGTGNDGVSTTDGIVVKADSTHYLICTGAGVRMQSGSNSIWVTDSGTSIGQAVFG